MNISGGKWYMGGAIIWDYRSWIKATCFFPLLANRGNNVPKKVQEMEVLFQFMMNKYYAPMKRKEIG